MKINLIKKQVNTSMLHVVYDTKNIMANKDAINQLIMDFGLVDKVAGLSNALIFDSDLINTMCTPNELYIEHVKQLGSDKKGSRSSYSEAGHYPQCITLLDRKLFDIAHKRIASIISHSEAMKAKLLWCDVTRHAKWVLPVLEQNPELTKVFGGNMVVLIHRVAVSGGSKECVLKMLTRLMKEHKEPHIVADIIRKQMEHAIPCNNGVFKVHSSKYVAKALMFVETICRGSFDDKGNMDRAIFGCGYYFFNAQIGKMSFANIRHIANASLWMSEHFCATKLRFMAPGFLLSIGKLSPLLRHAACCDIDHVYKEIVPEDIGRFKYHVSRRSINWEAVKEMQDMILAGKHRNVAKMECMPPAMGFYRDTGLLIKSKDVSAGYNLKAINLIKKIDVSHVEFPTDVVRVSNIFGMESAKVLAQFGNKVHAVVNSLNLGKSIALTQAWNQFMFNNQHVARYAGFVTDGMPVPKSVEAMNKIVFMAEYNSDNYLLSVAAARNKLNKSTFNEYASYIAGSPHKTYEMLPGVYLNGNDHECPGYSIEKLEYNDPTALMIGLETDCCQHLDGHNSASAKHSWTEPSSAVYVLKKDDEIIAETWAWRNTEDGVVFDSIEAKGGISVKAATILFSALAHSIVGKMLIKNVYIGKTNYGITDEIRRTICISNDSICSSIIKPCYLEDCSSRNKDARDGKVHQLVATYCAPTIAEDLFSLVPCTMCGNMHSSNYVLCEDCCEPYAYDEDGYDDYPDWYEGESDELPF